MFEQFEDWVKQFAGVMKKNNKVYIILYTVILNLQLYTRWEFKIE